MDIVQGKRRKVWIIGRRGEAVVECVKQLTRESGLHVADGVYAERHAACAMAGLGAPLATSVPLRAPHHSVTSAMLTGRLNGHMWRPGEMELAHGGILYLDDATEFSSSALAVVEAGWRLGYVRHISSTKLVQDPNEHDVNRLTVPTWFSLVLSTLPCPCGNRGAKLAPCPCTDRDIERFHEKLRPLTAGAEVIRP